MESSADPAKTRSRQILARRLFWFMAGAGFSYLMITTPFDWLKKHTHFPVLLISACSYTVSTCLFFLWNYFVNFRTDVQKHEAFYRYLAAVVLMACLNSLLLAFLELWHPYSGHGVHFNVIATQFLLAGPKFALYHKWAFPPAAAAPPEAAAA